VESWFYQFILAQANQPFLDVCSFQNFTDCGAILTMFLNLIQLEFQRLYTPTAFREERALWRSVILLNLARSVRVILDAVAAVLRSRRTAAIDSGGDDGEEMEADADAFGPLEDVRALAYRCEPVRTVEAALAARLVPAHEEDPTRLSASGDEPYVRPGMGLVGGSTSGFVFRNGNGPARASGSMEGGSTSSDEAAPLRGCIDAMIELWAHPSVREILRRRKIKLEESPGL
jgi:guanine nucleotide-binding protein alpha-1 subunit